MHDTIVISLQNLLLVPLLLVVLGLVVVAVMDAVRETGVEIVDRAKRNKKKRQWRRENPIFLNEEQIR